MVNFRHRYAVIAVRVLFGAFLMFSGFGGLQAGLSDFQGIPEPMVPATKMLWDMGLFQMIKVTELVAGLMLVVGFLPALAAIFIAPLAIGIVVFNARMSPEYLPTGMIVCLFNAYLGYVYWDKYKALFQRDQAKK